MKKIEICIDAADMDKFRECMNEAAIEKYLFSKLYEFDSQNEIERKYRGALYQKRYCERLKIEALVNTMQLQKIIECLSQRSKTGTLKIYQFISFDIDDLNAFISK